MRFDIRFGHQTDVRARGNNLFVVGVILAPSAEVDVLAMREIGDSPRLKSRGFSACISPDGLVRPQVLQGFRPLLLASSTC